MLGGEVICGHAVSGGCSRYIVYNHEIFIKNIWEIASQSFSSTFHALVETYNRFTRRVLGFHHVCLWFDWCFSPVI